MSPTPVSRLLTIAVALLAIGLIGPSGFAADSQRFVDIDGDGFNDNAPDSDADGIPDGIEFHGFLSAQPNLVLRVNPTPINASALMGARACASERFGSREFATRGIAVRRADFDAGFGSGLGLSGGQGGSGGGCVGGVCRR